MTRTHTTPDGATLLVRDWPPTGSPWAQLLLVHGVGEHAGRYERTGGILAAAGIAVTAFDLRGHGGSSGRRGDVERWTDLTGDVGRLLAEVRMSAEGRPVVLMGHSMGGLICLDAVLSGAATPDRLILSSPGLGDGLPAWQHRLAPLMARLRPTMVIKNAWDSSALSRDPEVARAADTDPLNLNGSTVRLGAQAFAAQDRVNAGIAALTIPTFVTHGGEDPLVPPRTSERLGALPGLTRRLYPTLRHETLNEPEGPQVAADMIAWLRASLASPGTAASPDPAVTP